MAVRTITTRLTLDGEKAWKKEMADINSALKTLASELKAVESQFRNNANSMEALTAKGDVLRRQYAQQEEKVRQLEKAVKDAAAAFGESDARTDRYRQSLNNARVQLDRLNDELAQNEKYLDEARSSADGAASSIDRFGDEVKQADRDLDGFDSGASGLLGKLGDMKGLLAGISVGGVISGAKELLSTINEIEESTREYRITIGALEISSQQAGYTAEETAEIYNRFYAVLGDSQAAATATANIQAMKLAQEDLLDVVDGVIGAWVTYGSSINIETLAEATNETLAVSKATSQFSDILNWAHISEDQFNESLEACATEAERANLILSLLREQGLTEAAEGWRELNEDVVTANDSQRRMEEAMGRLGEVLAPYSSGLRDVGAEAVLFLADAIDAAEDAINRFMAPLDNLMDKISDFEYRVRRAFGGGASTGRGFSGSGYDGSHANGLRSVPYDGYIAEMHAGEEIVTAREVQQRALTEEGMGQMMVQLMNAVEGGTGPREVVLHVTTTLGGATVDEQIYRCNLRAQERHGEQLVKQ
ncbi:MAG: hypothetical protein IKA50_01880 [Clostridia bacterium]|nr:hypothetical protein [Clostridia bacterium]